MQVGKMSAEAIEQFLEMSASLRNESKIENWVQAWETSASLRNKCKFEKRVLLEMSEKRNECMLKTFEMWVHLKKILK